MGEGGEEQLFCRCASCLMVKWPRSGAWCCDNSARCGPHHTDMAAVCHRWRDGRDRRGEAEEGEVRHGVKITQSYKRLAVGERCNTAEENRRRQSRGRRGSDVDGEDSHSETFRLRWLILMMSDLVRSVYWAVLTCCSRQWWVMPRFIGAAFSVHMDSQLSMLAVRMASKHRELNSTTDFMLYDDHVPNN